MTTYLMRIAGVVVLALQLTACGGGADIELSASSYGAADRSTDPQQCVPYARSLSGINIYGDAYTWWGQAEGKFDKRHTPSKGAVLVLNNYAGPDRAHLAVVRQIDSSRQIRVDHANWFNDGEVYVDDPVMDVSPDNDWSQVRVFNVRTRAWGGKTYPVQGFIALGRPAVPLPSAPPAPRENDAIAQLLMADASE